MYWNENIKKLERCLLNLSVTDKRGNVLNQQAAYEELVELTRNTKQNGNTVFLVGNGASSSMASHVAADLAKNAKIHTQVFTDLALITAVANDIAYSEVFAEPLKSRMKKNDMLIAISSSGASPNILRAAAQAKECGGQVITFSAMKTDNPLRTLGVLNFYIPAESYGMAENSHNVVLHYWIDLMTGDIKIDEAKAVVTVSD